MSQSESLANAFEAVERASFDVASFCSAGEQTRAREIVDGMVREVDRLWEALVGRGVDRDALTRLRILSRLDGVEGWNDDMAERFHGDGSKCSDRAKSARNRADIAYRVELAFENVKRLAAARGISGRVVQFIEYATRLAAYCSQTVALGACSVSLCR